MGRVWDVADGGHECVSTLRNTDRPCSLYCIAQLANGRLVTGSYRALAVWDMVSEICEYNLEGGSGFVHCVAALADGRMIAGSSDKLLRVWEVGPARCTCVLTLKGHTHDVLCVLQLGDGRVVSGSRDGMMRIWDVVGGGT